MTPKCAPDVFQACQFGVLFENEETAYRDIIPALGHQEDFPKYVARWNNNSFVYFPSQHLRLIFFVNFLARHLLSGIIILCARRTAASWCSAIFRRTDGECRRLGSTWIWITYWLPVGIFKLIQIENSGTWKWKKRSPEKIHIEAEPPDSNINSRRRNSIPASCFSIPLSLIKNKRFMAPITPVNPFRRYDSESWERTTFSLFVDWFLSTHVSYIFISATSCCMTEWTMWIFMEHNENAFRSQ